MTTLHSDPRRTTSGRQEEIEYGLSPEVVAKRLYAKAQKVGSEWKTRCPAHDDHKPSLSIRRGDNGDLVVRCWAGCENRAVIAALADLHRISVFAHRDEGWPANTKTDTSGRISDL